MSREDRVELRWPGKRGAGAPAVPTLALEVEQRVGDDGPRDLLICADNLLAMQALLATHAGGPAARSTRGPTSTRAAPSSRASSPGGWRCRPPSS